jgi:hypothetical protein
MRYGDETPITDPCVLPAPEGSVLFIYLLVKTHLFRIAHPSRVSSQTTYTHRRLIHISKHETVLVIEMSMGGSTCT